MFLINCFNILIITYKIKRDPTIRADRFQDRDGPDILPPLPD